MKYYLIDYNWLGQIRQNLYRKSGDEECLLALQDDDGWIMRSKDCPRRFRDEVGVEITEEEAAMILFGCKEQA